MCEPVTPEDAGLIDLAPSFTDVRYAARLGPEEGLLGADGDISLLGLRADVTSNLPWDVPLAGVFPATLLRVANSAAANRETRERNLVVAHNTRSAAADHSLLGDEPIRWLHHRWRIHFTADSRTLLVGAARDVTADIRAHDNLQASERLYRRIAENSADFAMTTNRDRVIEFVSESITEALGWQPSDLVGHQTAEFIHPEDLAQAKVNSDRVNAGESVYLRSRFLAADGTYRWMAQHVRPITDSSGEVVSRSGVWRDISAEVTALAALEASEETFRTAMESAPSGIALLDDQRRFVAVNSALCEILRRDRYWLLTHGIDDVIEAPNEGPHPDVLVGRSRVERDSHVEFRCRRGDGETIWVRQAIGVPHGKSRGEVAYVAHIIDVTKERAARERLHFLADHDDLTRHLRPGALLALLAELLQRSSAADHRVGALYVDVDYLKTINDTYGHACGDDVIRTVARRISATVRASDLVGRIGGDEFVVVLPQVRTADDVVVVGQKIRDACREPVLSDGHSISVSLSMGGALSERGDDAETLLHRADLALYRSKRAGRDCLTMSSKADHEPHQDEWGNTPQTPAR